MGLLSVCLLISGGRVDSGSGVYLARGNIKDKKPKIKKQGADKETTCTL